MTQRDFYFERLDSTYYDTYILVSKRLYFLSHNVPLSFLVQLGSSVFSRRVFTAALHEDIADKVKIMRVFSCKGGKSEDTRKQLYQDRIS